MNDDAERKRGLLAELADAERRAELADAARAVTYAAEQLIDADRAGTVCRADVERLADTLDTLTGLRSRYIAGGSASVPQD